jgi:hypothetical protein
VPDGGIAKPQTDSAGIAGRCATAPAAGLLWPCLGSVVSAAAVRLRLEHASLDQHGADSLGAWAAAAMNDHDFVYGGPPGATGTPHRRDCRMLVGKQHAGFALGDGKTPAQLRDGLAASGETREQTRSAGSACRTSSRFPNGTSRPAPSPTAASPTAIRCMSLTTTLDDRSHRSLSHPQRAGHPAAICDLLPAVPERSKMQPRPSATTPATCPTGPTRLPSATSTAGGASSSRRAGPRSAWFAGIGTAAGRRAAAAACR